MTPKPTACVPSFIPQSYPLYAAQAFPDGPRTGVVVAWSANVDGLSLPTLSPVVAWEEFPSDMGQLTGEFRISGEPMVYVAETREAAVQIALRAKAEDEAS